MSPGSETAPAPDLHPPDPALAPGFAHAPAADPPPPGHTPGGSRELLALAAPLVLSQSFMTIQVIIDRVLLSRHSPDELAASLPAVMLFWLGFGTLQGVAGYVSTFVAQYTGAGRPHRVGPAVWQGLWFALAGGLLFLLVVPLAPALIGLTGHDSALAPLEVTYLQYLACAGLPMLVVAAVNGFFSGRGDTWTVLLIDAVGTAVNCSLALTLIFGCEPLGLPEMGIAGAGVAIVVGSYASAGLAVVMLLRPKFRAEFGTLTGWRPERELFGRLLRYGGPAGLQMFLDILAFTLFILFVDRIGEAAAGAASLTITLNMVAFLPMLGLGQAVCILVGQRLGEDRPEVAERTTYTGLRWMLGYISLICLVYVTLPGVLLSAFASDREPDKFAAIAAVVPSLLVVVAVYSLVDAANLTFAFALRGAGDTQFVTWLTFALSWPLMVIPTYLTVINGGSILWCWGYAAVHIVVMSVCFWLRFRTGRWKTMRVIERAREDDGVKG